jgi:hypothetical protein
MQIVSRARWGALHERGFGPAPLPAAEVWLHHSVTNAPGVQLTGDDLFQAERAAMRILEDIGEQRFGRGISYTFAVMPSGRVYEGHGVDRQGAHTKGRNSIARAIVLVGNYDTARVTNAQRHAIAELLRHGQRAGWWRHACLNGGHQQAPGAQTACPGRFARSAISDINRLAAAPAPPAEPEEENVKPFQDLILAREAEDAEGSSWPAVYVGNGVIRRHVTSERALADLQHRIREVGGDPTVHEGWAPGSLAGVLGMLVREES